MVRRVIWSQVLLLLVAATATLADRGFIPRYLFPPQVLLTVSYFFSFILPIVVIILSLQRKLRLRAFIESATSVAILVATLFALLPAVQ
jgi:hypothetical protein